MRKQMLGEIKNLWLKFTAVVTQPWNPALEKLHPIATLEYCFLPQKIVFPMQTTKNFSEIQIFAY